MTRFLVRGLVACALIVGAILSTSAASGQDDDDPTTELEELELEREELIDDNVETLEAIDVATVSVDQVTEQLDAIRNRVLLQESRLREAEDVLAEARSAVDAARSRRQEVLVEIDVLRDHITNLAVASFIGETSARGEDLTELALSSDPGEAARFKHLLELQTGSLTDSLDHVRRLEIEADQLIDVEAQAVAEAEEVLGLVETRTAELQSLRDAQANLVTAAETRLEARLAEAAFVAERDEQLATEIRDQQQAINQRLAGVARQNGIEIPPPVDLDDIVSIRFPGTLLDEELRLGGEDEDGDGVPDDGRIWADIEHPSGEDYVIEVHIDIADETLALFTEAFEQGVELAGWGYRPIQRQIELRAAHCGGTPQEIWHKPVFECAPPTARPGFSKHEQGRAIDFTLNGGSISTEASAGFAWLSEHAPKYGFVNLQGEPWHWSIDEGQGAFD